MQERMSLMIFGTTLRFYICFDFLTRLLLGQRGLQSSSHCNLFEGEAGLEFRDLRLHYEDDGHSVGKGLRIMVSTTENFPSWAFCSFSQERERGCVSVKGRTHEYELSARLLGNTKQNQIGGVIPYYVSGDQVNYIYTIRHTPSNMSLSWRGIRKSQLSLIALPGCIRKYPLIHPLSPFLWQYNGQPFQTIIELFQAMREWDAKWQWEGLLGLGGSKQRRRWASILSILFLENRIIKFIEGNPFFKVYDQIGKGKVRGDWALQGRG